jgi:hypothetical protein
VMRKLKSTSLKFVKLAVPVEMPCKATPECIPPAAEQRQQVSIQA